MKDFISSIDPVLGQFIVLPLIVIGLGVLLSTISKKILVGPITTIVLTSLFELWFHNSLSLWGIIYAIFTLILTMPIVLYVNPNNTSD